ncbi:hypothetical protein KJS94_02390 [Flavihumibacter rivuli]|uniref:AtpZ/AtpI family protein n=1 Tax=Flavihumibacter rivuli TaxID=2838156 RepID=UPI001BDE6D95|nr:AtpZ/AtpI family protein [Flavihumibacter rivuli]ULQ57045.1 hypothetical protein KJS94_02390 [Flavihumibacter rivuli]
MKNRKPPTQPDPKNWLHYIGLGTQLMVALGLAIWAGIWLDDRLKWSMPLFVWTLPLLVIGVTIFKLIKETGKRSDGK